MQSQHSILDGPLESSLQLMRDAYEENDSDKNYCACIIARYKKAVHLIPFRNIEAHLHQSFRQDTLTSKPVR